MERFPGEFPSYIGSPESIPADAGPWERVVRLERQREWLDLKCDELRRSCLELSRSLNGRSPLTAEDMVALRATPPRRPWEEVYERFRQMRDEVSAPLPPPPDESAEALTTRAAALAAAVAGLRDQRLELRRMHNAVCDVVMPWEPTEEEIADMVRVMNGPPGPSILDVLAEVEAELARGG